MRFSALGDVAMTIPVLKAVLTSYPDLKITVVSKPFLKPLFALIPEIRFVGADINAKHKGVGGLFRLSKQLKALGVEAVADLHDSLRTKIMRRCFFLFRMPVKIINKGKKERWLLMQSKAKELTPMKSVFKRYSDVFEALGFTIENTALKPFKQQKLPASCSALFAKKATKKIGLAPFAAHQGKMLPPKKLEELLQFLEKEKSWEIFLIGGGTQEVEALDTIAKGHERFRNMAGRFSFENELAIISNLDAMIAMDSGNGHLSSLFGVPTITLWGVTHPAMGFGPLLQPETNWFCADRTKYPKIPTSSSGSILPKGYENAIETLSIEAIIRRLHTILKT